MYVLSFLLLIISLSKLLIAFSSNKLEMKELLYNNPVLSKVPPGILSALLTFDGLIGLFCSLYILS